MGIDWTALGEEAVDLLRRYLMIDTTNPPGNEIEGAKFLAAVLGRDGIASETVESAPGRANLVARLAGDGSLPGIVLHHHIDVVYADRRYWTVDPFGGAIRDGYLYGRGAIDMKSTGIMHLTAVLALKRGEVHDPRDRKSTRLNSSHSQISYAVFCLKKKKHKRQTKKVTYPPHHNHPLHYSDEPGPIPERWTTHHHQLAATSISIRRRHLTTANLASL